MPTSPSPQFSRRCAVTTTTRRSLSCSACSSGFANCTSSVDAQCSASMPVLPVTKIWPTGTFSRTRFCRLVEVGAKCRPAIRVISSRFSSSGNGVRLLPPVRSPASTCMTGMRRWKADRAAAIAERRVAVDEHGGREPTVEDVLGVRHRVGLHVEALGAEVLEAADHRRDALVEVGVTRPRPEDDVGLDADELEDVADDAVVLPGRDDQRLIGLAVAEGEDDRHELDRLGTRPDDDREHELRGGPACVHSDRKRMVDGAECPRRGRGGLDGHRALERRLRPVVGPARLLVELVPRRVDGIRHPKPPVLSLARPGYRREREAS